MLPSRVTNDLVAPRAGAWIETSSVMYRFTFFRVAPRAGAWIETENLQNIAEDFLVAPRAGAWIETQKAMEYITNPKSHPARVRGLKPL